MLHHEPFTVKWSRCGGVASSIWSDINSPLFPSLAPKPPEWPETPFSPTPVVREPPRQLQPQSRAGHQSTAGRRRAWWRTRQRTSLRPQTRCVFQPVCKFYSMVWKHGVLNPFTLLINTFASAAGRIQQVLFKAAQFEPHCATCVSLYPGSLLQVLPLKNLLDALTIKNNHKKKNINVPGGLNSWLIPNSPLKLSCSTKRAIHLFSCSSKRATQGCWIIALILMPFPHHVHVIGPEVFSAVTSHWLAQHCQSSYSLCCLSKKSLHPLPPESHPAAARSMKLLAKIPKDAEAVIVLVGELEETILIVCTFFFFFFAVSVPLWCWNIKAPQIH